MEDQNQNTNTQSNGAAGTPLDFTNSGGSASYMAENDALSLNPTTLSDEPIAGGIPKKRTVVSRLLARVDLILLALLVLGAVGLVVSGIVHKRHPVVNSNASTQFGTVQLPLNQFVGTEDTVKLTVGSVVINGALKLNSGLVVSPSVQPNAPTAGQLYYDQNTNQLAYYNGTAFVPLTASSAVVQSIGGATGTLTLGGGLSVIGNQLTSATGVTNIAGRTGGITLGGGLSMVGNTLQNSGVLDIVAGSNITVTNNGNGTYTVNNVGAGTGTVTSGGGSNGALALFTGSQNIEDSLITQSGTTITITGDLNVVTGGLSLGNALTVPNGGTGTTSLAANGVVVASGTAPLTSVTSGSPGLCFLSTAGAPTFAACPSSSGVSSLNGLTGALSVANASAGGSTITIDNASTITKGIASFNATNFTASSGAINTVQNINSSATPTFGGLTLSSSQATNPMLVINNTNVGGSGNLLDLQLNGSSKFSVQPNGNALVTGTINGQTISATANFTGSLGVSGATTISGALNANGGAINSTGALNITPTGTLTAGSSGQTLALQGNGSSTIAVTGGGNTTTVSFQAPTANVTYRFAAAAANTYDICTTAGNCTGVGGGVTTPGGTINRLSKFTGGQTIGDSSISDNGTTVTTTGSIVIQGGSATVGVANTQTGSLTLAYGSANFSGTLTQGALTASRAYTLPDFSGTVCLSSGNCLGGGGGGANTALSNLSGVAINTSLLPGATSIDLGSGTAPFRELYFAGTSATPGTNNFKITGASTGGTRTVTFPDSSGTVCLNNSTNCGFLTGTGTAFVQNGNSLGTAANVGTADNFAVNVITNGTARLTIATNGDASLTGDLAVNGGDITSSGNLNITPTGTLTAGSTGQVFTLQGSNTSTITATNGANTTTVSFQTPTANVNYRFPTAPANTYDICTTVGNCAGTGTGVTTSGGTIGTIPVFTASQALGDSLLSQSGGTVTANGNLSLTSGKVYQINGTQITSAALSNDADLAKLSASETFTGNAVGFKNGSNSVNSFNIQNAGGNRVLTADTTNGQMILGQASAVDGKLVFNNITNGFTTTILPGTPTANRTITLPNASGIICLDSGNCAGAGATLQTAYNFSAGGTTPKIKVNSSLLGVDIQDADTTIAANLFNVRASNNAGLGSVMFGVGSTGQVTFQNSANSTTALNVLTQGGTRVLTIDTSNGQAVLGQSTTLAGTLVFNNATNSNQTTLTTAVAGAARTVTLPDESGTVCLQNSTNCGFAITSGSTAYIQNQFAGTQTGNYKIQGSGDHVVGILRASVGQTADVFQVQNSGGSSLFQIDSDTNFSTFNDNLIVNGAGASTKALELKSGATSSSSGDIIASFEKADGTVVGQYTNKGMSAGNLSGLAGLFSLTDGAHGVDITAAALSVNRTQSFPDESGTICLQNSSNCGFVKNQFGSAQTGNFNLQSNGDHITGVLRASVGQTADIFQVQNSGGSPLFQIDSDTNNATFTDNVTVVGQSSGALVVKSSNNGSGSVILDAQRANGVSMARIDDNGVLGLGNISGIGGTLGIEDGTTTHFGQFQGNNLLTSDRNYYMPNSSGVLCLDSGNCGATIGTLQAGYNFSAGGTTPEIKLDNTRFGLDIQDADTTLGGAQNFITFRGPNAGGLGANLFGVGMQGNLFMQPSTDRTDFIDINNHAGNNLFEVDSSNNRVGIAQGGSTLPTYTLDVNGDTNISTGSVFRINGTSTLSSGSLNFSAASTNTIQAAASQALNISSTSDLTLSTNSASAKIIAKSTTNGASAFQIQDSASASLLNANTLTRTSGVAGNMLKIGDSTGTDTATTILQLDATTANPTTNLASLSGGLFYNSTTNKVSLIENGVVKIICNTTDLGCGTGTVTLQNAYNNSVGPPTSEIIVDNTRGALDIQDRSTSNGGTIAANLLNVRATAATDGTVGTLMLGVGNTGAVLLQNSADSANALQVKNALGTATAFDVDTSNTRIGIGTAAPARTLDIATNDSNTTAPAIRLLQGGSGDATVELSNSATSFFAGVDTSDSSLFKISSSAATGATSKFGYTSSTWNNQFDAGNQNLISSTLVTSGASAGTVNSISVYIGKLGGLGEMQVAIYSNKTSGCAGGHSNCPNALIANSATFNLTQFGWNTIPITASVSGNTKYWLGFNVDDGGTAYAFANGVGSDESAYFDTAGGTTPFGTWPANYNSATYGTNASEAATPYRIYATYTTTTADTFAGNLFSLSSDGAAAFKNTTNSTQAFQVKNSGGSAVLSVDTSNNDSATNLIADGGFEQGMTGWAVKDSGNGPEQRVDQHHDGHASLYVEGGNGVGGGGVEYNITLTDALEYIATFYVKEGTGDAPATTLEAGYNNGSTNNPCTQNTTSFNSLGWTRIECTIKTPASHSGTPHFYIRRTDQNINDMFIDDVFLSSDYTSFGIDSVRNGGVDFQGVVQSDLRLQGSTNSTSAFTIQNQYANNILNVDTTDPNNLILNPSFEKDLTSGLSTFDIWGAVGAGTTVSRDTTQAYAGTASLKIVTGATAAAGTSLPVHNTYPTQLLPSTTYTMSWYAKLSSGSFTDIKAGYARDGATWIDCIPSSQTVVTGGWTRFTCSFATIATLPTNNAAIRIVQTAGSAHTFWIDALRLEKGSVANAYGEGSISMDASITSALSLHNTSDSTTAFLIQNAAGSNVFSVDTLNSAITVGNSGNTLSFTTAGGLVASGSARHTKTLLLTPEFAGGVLDAQNDASCSAAFSGTMTSGYDLTNRMNYYNWTAALGSAQCYDVVVQVPIPADFSGSWSGNPDIEMQKDSTGTAAYAIQITPSSGSDANYGSFAVHNTLTTSWSNMANNPLSGTYTAGDYLTIKVRLTSTSGANVKLGNIKLQYLSTF